MAYKTIHKDTNFNFQLNRLLSYGDEACKESEIINLSKEISDFETWYIQWLKIALLAQSEKRYLHSMYYYRMSEFFLADHDKRKNEAYHKMREMFKKAQPDAVKINVPFREGHLPVLIVSPEKVKGTLLIHGGYDSFIEEFYLIAKKFSDKGYKVCLFEGEGQGATLRDGMVFNYKWEDSVKAILDYLKIDSCSLIGISWGGYFALRAASKEKRIKNVVAYDIMYDGLDTQLSVLGSGKKFLIKTLIKLKRKKLINKLINSAIKKSPLADWAISHGIYITRSKSPYEFYKNIEQHTLKHVVKDINQNVLLLAGEKDHYIPLKHFDILKRKLVNASVKSRLFLEEEGGEQHCQVGNYNIALDCIFTWLDDLHQSN